MELTLFIYYLIDFNIKEEFYLNTLNIYFYCLHFLRSVNHNTKLIYLIQIYIEHV